MATDNTKIDFKYCMDQINRNIDLDYNEQSTYLNSNDANMAFNEIETALNTLYENTRYLEDAINYCNAFLNIKIDEYSQDIKETLKAIENIRDINKNSSYIEYICKFKDDLSIKKDRNNTDISNALLKDSYYMLGIKKDLPISYTTITKTGVNVPYSNNINNIKTENYRTYYIEEKIANKGITESITITLNEPSEINYINIKAINSNIENMRLVYINGVEDYIDYDSGIFSNSIVTQIKFDLVCKKYTTSTYYMDRSKVTDDI